MEVTLWVLINRISFVSKTKCFSLYFHCLVPFFSFCCPQTDAGQDSEQILYPYIFDDGVVSCFVLERLRSTKMHSRLRWSIITVVVRSHTSLSFSLFLFLCKVCFCGLLLYSSCEIGTYILSFSLSLSFKSYITRIAGNITPKDGTVSNYSVILKNHASKNWKDHVCVACIWTPCQTWEHGYVCVPIFVMWKARWPWNCCDFVGCYSSLCFSGDCSTCFLMFHYLAADTKLAFRIGESIVPSTRSCRGGVFIEYLPSVSTSLPQWKVMPGFFQLRDCR